MQIWGPRYSVFVVRSATWRLHARQVPDDERDGTCRGRRSSPARSRTRLACSTARSAMHSVSTQLASLRHDDRHDADPVGRRASAGRLVGPAARGGSESGSLELARRYLAVFGPARPKGSSTGRASGQGRPGDFDALEGSVIPVRTPTGDAWILTGDEEAFRRPAGPTAAARLLPSGDAFYLVWGTDRELLVSDARRRGALWASRVWPGAVCGRRDRRDLESKPAQADGRALAAPRAPAWGGRGGRHPAPAVDCRSRSAGRHEPAR